MPPNTVYVGRPTKWGNPYKVGEFDSGFGRKLSLQDCLGLYELFLNSHDAPSIEELRGKDLACWCPLDKPCHADVLLRLANENSRPRCNALPARWGREG
jgi:hypothetical protein